MPPRPLYVILAVAVLISGAATIQGSSADEYEISIDDSIDVPDRTISFEGEEYRVTSVAVHDPDETVTVDVTAPDVQSVSVQLYKPNGDFYAADNPDESGTATFGPDDFGAPGTYVIALSYDSKFRAVHPLLLEAYGVSATIPGSIDAGSDFSVSATLTEKSDEDLSGVELVVAADDEAWAYEMDRDGDEYSVDVPGGDLDAGSYTLYVAAIGTETVDGTELPIGVSERHDLTVEEATPTPTESSGGNGGFGGGNGGSEASPTPTATPGNATATTMPGNATATPEGGSTSTATETGSEASATETVSSTPTRSTTAATRTTQAPSATTTQATTETTDDSVITPDSGDDGTTDSTATASPGQPGFTILLALVAVALVAVRRRHRR